MDILVSSNLERQLFELTGRNAQAIAGWMDDLNRAKRFEIDADTLDKLHADFASASVDSETRLANIMGSMTRITTCWTPTAPWPTAQPRPCGARIPS